MAFSCATCRFPDWEARHFKQDSGNVIDFTLGSLGASALENDCPACKLLRDIVAEATKMTNFAISPDSPVYLQLSEKEHLLLSYPVKGENGEAFAYRRVDIFTLPGQPRFFSARVGSIPIPDGASDASFARAQEWLHACTSTHRRCSIVDSPTFVPARLVDVNYKHDAVRVVDATTSLASVQKPPSFSRGSPSEIGSLLSKVSNARTSLVDAVRKVPMPGRAPRLSRTEPAVRYITLSHCWGDIKSETFLTSENYDSHTGVNGVSIARLPRTFQDAIFLTRKLGVQYLWIDSLCIIQDSEEDWHKQSSQMSYVYSHSWLTLAATGAASDDDGFFPRISKQGQPLHAAPAVRRKPTALKQHTTDHAETKPPSFEAKEYTFGHSGRKYSVYARPELPHPDDPYLFSRHHEMPLLTRGWTFQERLLSRRVLHFGCAELLWECMEGVGCECSYRPPHLWSKDTDNPEVFLGRMEQTKAWYAGVRTRKSAKWLVYNDWRRVCLRYSELQLTFAEDKLSAISGVAKQFRDVLKDDYLAGCWRKSLIENIGWFLRDFPANKPRPSHTIPSWSWAAAADGRIIWNLSHEHFLNIVDAQTFPVTEDETGRVRGGYLDVRGLAIDASLWTQSMHDPGESTVEAMVRVWLKVTEPGSNEDGDQSTTLYPDYQFWRDEADFLSQIRDVTLLLYSKRDIPLEYAAIVLQRCPSDTHGAGCFQRIGFAMIRASRSDFIARNINNPWRKIRII